MKPADDKTAISAFERWFWRVVLAVAVVVLVLWAIEALLARPAETFNEQMERIVAALPDWDPLAPPTPEDILDSIPAGELSTIGRPGALFIIEYASKSPSETAPRRLRTLVYYTRKRRRLDALKDLLAGDDASLAQAAADVLGVPIDEGDREVFAATLAAHYDAVAPAVKAHALLALANLGARDDVMRRRILSALESQTAALRAAGCDAAYVLSLRDETGGLRRALEARTTGDAQEHVRRAALRALVACGSRESLPALLDRLANGGPHEQRYAIVALRRFAHSADAERIQQAGKTLPDELKRDLDDALKIIRRKTVSGTVF